MNTPLTTHPLTFEQFEEIYHRHLGHPSRPSCYKAYLEAEAEVTRTHGERRYKNYQTFVATRTRATRQNNNNTPSADTKVPIKCQLCETELYTVPRGDLRTIIPHICEDCREEIKKLIFV